jgi:hypothetical protein
MIHKTTSTTSNWNVYHRALTTPNANPESNAVRLNTTDAGLNSTAWITAPTATEFTVGSALNASATTYVVYLFAHNAGGFGLTGTDNVISCGSYTGNGSSSGPTVTLGYEPQWVLVKKSSALGDWVLFDNMRSGLMLAGNTLALFPNLSDAESSPNGSNDINATATGFNLVSTSGSTNTSGATYIYIAIRRGPMKVPTDATKVFTPVFASSSGPYTATAGFPVDLDFYGDKSNTDKWFWFDRLRGSPFLQSNTIDAETASTGKFDSNTAFSLTATGNFSNFINYALRRAPGFFDEVCFGATGQTNPAVNHNLGVAPEFIIHKPRSINSQWTTAHVIDFSKNIVLNSTAASVSFPMVSNVNASTVNIDFGGLGSQSATKVIYFFASAPGVSKVGSYTGTGATQVINCGFTAGARFVLIKAFSTTGNWLVWDSARGIVAGNDPYLELNTSNAEVTNTDWVDTAASGFELSNAGGNLANSNGVSYIFLAIA